MIDSLVNPCGRWTEYAVATDRSSYGQYATYQPAAEFLDKPGWLVEDWGCGLGYAKQFFREASYLGVDGTKSAFCDVVDDLRFRKSFAQGILLRHVLEHNLMWQWILQGATRAAQYRIAIVFFLPFVSHPVITEEEDPRYPGVVTLHLVESDVESILSGWRIRRILFGSEQIWLCERKG